jgi:hypothetical protein
MVVSIYLAHRTLDQPRKYDHKALPLALTETGAK